MKRSLLRKGLREIWRSKFQYAGLIIILGMGIAMFISFHNMGVSRWDTFYAVYDEAEYMDVQVKLQYGVTANGTAVDAILDDAGVSDDIGRAEYRLTYDVFLSRDDGGEEKITRGQVMGFRAFDESGSPRDPAVNRPLFYSDEPREFTAPDADECYIEHAFAEENDLGRGDTVTVKYGAGETELTILETVNVIEYLMVIEEGSFFPSAGDFGVILVPLETANAMFATASGPAGAGGGGGNGGGGNVSGRPASGGPGADFLVNDLVFIRADGVKMKDIKRDLESAFSHREVPVHIVGAEENPARAFIAGDLETDTQSMDAFPAIIFLVSGFGLWMTLRRMIQTHRPQIGVFKSLGVPDRTVLGYFTTIGLFVGIFSVIVGLVLSIPFNAVFMGMMRELQDWAVKEYSVSWASFAAASTISMVLCLVCAIIPALGALRMKPIDAIQAREGINLGRKRKKRKGKTGGEKAGGMPVALKLSMRNLGRRPWRTISTVLGVALALSLFTMMVVIEDSIMDRIDSDQENNLWDYQVTMAYFSPSDVSAGWGVDAGELNTGFMMPTEMHNGDGKEDAVVYALEDLKRSIVVDFERGGLASGGVAISDYMAKKLDVEVGDEVELLLPKMTGPMQFSTSPEPVEVSGIHTNHMGFTAFMDRATMEGLTNLTGTMNLAFIHTGDGEDVELENTIITTPGVSSVTHVDERSSSLESTMELFTMALVFMGLISTILAAAILYNLFMISAEENKREYATMKTLGTSMGRIANLVLIEAAFVSVLGIILGILGGYAFSYVLMTRATAIESMNLTLGFSLSAVVMSAMMVVSIVLLVSALALRYISKINIANVIKDRST